MGNQHAPGRIGRGGAPGGGCEAPYPVIGVRCPVLVSAWAWRCSFAIVGARSLVVW